MVTMNQVVKGAIGHLFLLLVNFAVLLGIIWSIRLLVVSGISLPLLNAIVLWYMIIHTSLLLSIQLGVQVLEIIKVRFPIILITYYFKFSDQETIPLPLLDPTKSRLAVIVLLLVISGGIVLYPLFAIYGILIIGSRLLVIAVDPSTIVDYFFIFLNYAPPLLLISLIIIILSIVLIEFKHV